ncbi:TRAP transporter substrate-binding protein [Photobacterium minamisatsumaniensis]|uniref:TRAP transporter substrate-binding protein n=1 Tax=Photobacterium minamisatsumaniensis TaxID=2910233 RepID=UPI003D101F39
MTKQRTLYSLVAGVGMLCHSYVVAAADTWDMPLAYSADNYHSVLAAEFAKTVNAQVGEEINIVTHPGGSLYKGNEIFGAVRRGLVPIGERLISALGNEDPMFEVDALPFVATGFDDSWTLYQASKPEMEKVLDKKGVKLLYSVPWPPQGLYAKKPVSSLDDMKGSKFRAYNPMTVELARMMGAVPTKVETAEMSQAFATGVTESMIASGSTGYDRKIWEYVTYWYDVNAWLPKDMVFVNKRAWNRLSPETQKVIEAAAADAEKAGWAQARELADWYKKELIANGMTVSEPTPELKEDFVQLGNKVVKQWLVKAGDGGVNVINKYNQQ